MDSTKDIAVILAAGKGTRMRSPCPKVLSRLCGRPLIEWVVRAVREAGMERVVAVVGDQKQEVTRVLEGLGVDWVEQPQPLGTGHALRVVGPLLEGPAVDIMALPGDSPLIRSSTLRALRDRHKEVKAHATLLTAYLEDPRGYGRVVRDGQGQVARVVEEWDTHGGEKDIKEVNTGVYYFKAGPLFEALERLTPENKKGEYYLTQVIELLRGMGKKVDTLTVADFLEVLGVNSQEDLARLSQIAYREKLRILMERGVTVVEPSSTFVEEGAEVGPGTIIFPFTYISGKVVVGKGCRIGPFVYLKDGTRVADGVEMRAV
ncbi:MAG: NTP transferase domain-containing protein [Candidatus Brocadiales bacterium]|nr:NTP transferase domain-containing protein [Candidatus Brocadiales bacterium]